MSGPCLTRHARTWAAQRALRGEDLELASRLGTEVEGGVLVRERDVRAYEEELRRQIARARRLVGARLVLAGNALVTAYRARPSARRRLLRAG